MKQINTHHDLLIALSRTGDASAFCTLLRKHATAAYLRLRARGLNHFDAQKQLIRSIRILYDRTYSLDQNISIDTWIAANLEKKSADLFSGSPLESMPSIQIGDLEQFNTGFDLFISRKYSAIRHKKCTGDTRRSLRRILYTLPVLRSTIYTIAAFLIGAAITTFFVARYLNKTAQRITIECIWHNDRTLTTIYSTGITFSQTAITENQPDHLTISLENNNEHADKISEPELEKITNSVQKKNQITTPPMNSSAPNIPQKQTPQNSTTIPRVAPVPPRIKPTPKLATPEAISDSVLPGTIHPDSAGTIPVN